MKNNQEFEDIINSYITREEFKDLKNYKHHGISRYEHLLRTAYYTYKVSKFFKLDYQEITLAALFHDYYHDEVKDLPFRKRLIKHPEYAIKNASKLVKLTPKQENIIRTHMFPITIKPPKYKEGWLVDIVDDIASLTDVFLLMGRKIKKIFKK